ncbi:hypothetical protein C7T94_00845 [Pedobacter yulinensis]|uniref:Peptidase M56 domain-containing protein n=1 Tax=Pedobacter yulinensis TaxID=2126353 RepID=A0A2T3HQH7_9SPHI|nr:M56 family metallopeptidase [Pedobacter yulinensis]PST84714.1 hypothetical protein C7T94_00845 [Pedobacter yulinensis]
MELLLYLLKASACLALFFGLYFFTLRKTTFFALNRTYLLAALLLAFFIPAWRVEVRQVVEPAVAEIAATTVPEPLITSVGSDLQPAAAPAPEPFAWPDPDTSLTVLYLAVTAGFLWPLLRQLSGLLQQRDHPYQRIGNLRVIYKNEGFTNCSFFRYVFVDPERLSKAEFDALLLHEGVHAARWHSLDKLFMQAARALLWFNPVVYWYARELEQLHEFEADQVTASQCGQEAYAHLLLGLARRPAPAGLTHSFVRHPIRERIEMLFTNQSNNMKKFVYLAALPVVAVLSWGFSVRYVEVPQERPVSPASRQDTGWRNNPAYRQALAGVDSLKGMPLEGRVGALWSDGFGQGFLLNTSSGTLQVALSHSRMRAAGLLEGAGIFVKLRGALIDQDQKITFVPTEIHDKTGKLLYKEKIVRQPFLYEANRARFAYSRISKLTTDASGHISALWLNDGHFSLRFNLAGQKLLAGNFRSGDSVLVKFFGEAKAGGKVYTSSKLIALYSQPRGKELRNPAHYSRFYQEDGRQQQVATTAGPENIPLGYQQDAGAEQHRAAYGGARTDVPVRVARFESISGREGITELTGADLLAGRFSIHAGKASLNRHPNQLKATDFKIIQDGKALIAAPGAQLSVNMNTGDFTVQEQLRLKDGDIEVEYSARDSTRVFKDRSRIDLFGKAEFKTAHFKIEGSRIEYDYKAQLVTAHDFAVVHSRRPGVRTTGSLLTVNFATGEYTVQGKM